MNKRKAKRITVKNPFSKLIVYVDTDNDNIISMFREQWKSTFVWWKFWKERVIFLPMGSVEVVRV